MSPKPAAGMKAAFGERRRVGAIVRFNALRGFRAAGRRKFRAAPDFIEFKPSVKSATEFAELSARVATYLGDAGIPLYLDGPRFPLQPALVPHFEPSLVRDPGWLSKRPEGFGYVVVHRLGPDTLRQMLMRRGPTRFADVRLHAYSEMEYFFLRNEISSPTYAPVETALDRVETVGAGDDGSAFILATGPSASGVDLKRVTAGVRITCNSAVRDLDRIQEFRPNIIACTDPVFHFGPSRYADAFRRDLVRAAEAVDALVVCGHEFAGPLLGLQPGLAPRLAVIPQRVGGPWRWPTRRNPTVRQAGNVLTGLMLPLALMLADEVAIAGADGRQPTEKYFWKHNANLQYSDALMKTVFDAHPAFFRDRDYADYYAQYCSDVEELARLGESQGKVVLGVASSWIPALLARGATLPSSEQ